jgi:drug/metabolite transporter (DMT)-like permease
MTAMSVLAQYEDIYLRIFASLGPILALPICYFVQGEKITAIATVGSIFAVSGVILFELSVQTNK